VAGGAALAGIAGGVALKSRNDSRRPLRALRSVQLPKSLKNMDLSKIDVDAVMNTARQFRSIGEQVGDVVEAAEKTRKKHK
jgi:glycerol dehydrogenase-like iron-containing ADH family enzyme